MYLIKGNRSADFQMDEDLQIIRRFKAGNKDAFSELVQKYTKPVLNLVYRVSGDPCDVEDLTQEVFLKAYKGLDKFKGDSKFFTWLYRIAVNVTLRAREKKSKVFLQSLEQKNENGNGNDNFMTVSQCPQDSLEKDEMQNKVREAIKELDEDYRTPLILFRYHELSYEEISEIMNLSVAAVKSRLHRARKALKDKLELYIRT
jgi:RNA polymerase sigma-70 factor (ECF subfamily)